MFYVYVLKSEKDGNNYVGYTNNLDERISFHNEGKVSSTKNRLPVKLIYFEGCLHQLDATRREKYLKMALCYDLPKELTPKESNMNNPGRSPVVPKKSNPNPERVEYENI